MIGSLASERAFQASQSPFVLRQTRLTVSFPTAPPWRAPFQYHGNVADWKRENLNENNACSGVAVEKPQTADGVERKKHKGRSSLR
jgi:hypothetical protein